MNNENVIQKYLYKLAQAITQLATTETMLNNMIEGFNTIVKTEGISIENVAKFVVQLTVLTRLIHDKRIELLPEPG
jgi:hypothetical protein